MRHKTLTTSSEVKHQALTSSPKGRRRGDKWKKWREEERKAHSNFKHDKVAILNNGFWINNKTVVLNNAF